MFKGIWLEIFRLFYYYLKHFQVGENLEVLNNGCEENEKNNKRSYNFLEEEMKTKRIKTIKS